MKSPFYFLVKPLYGKRYNNTKNISGVDFITSSSEEDYKFSTRQAEVIETPLNYKGPIQSGDILLVHHNVFKYYNDMRGRQKSGKSYFKDDLFFVDNDQFFMYKTEQGGIVMTGIVLLDLCLKQNQQYIKEALKNLWWVRWFILINTWTAKG